VSGDFVVDHDFEGIVELEFGLADHGLQDFR